MKLIKGGRRDEPQPTGFDRITADPTPENYAIWDGTKVPVDGRPLDIHMINRARAAILGSCRLRPVEDRPDWREIFGIEGETK